MISYLDFEKREIEAQTKSLGINGRMLGPIYYAQVPSSAYNASLHD